MLTVFDSNGCGLGSLALRPGDNVEVAARKILREKKSPSSFYAPIHYPRTYH